MNRCGYCHQRGHNRATCQKLKDYVKENPTSYTAGRDRVRKERMTKRTCSYCHLTGHNKKTCPQIKIDTDVAAKANRTFRKDFLTRCEALGFGPGTLVEFKLPEDASEGQRQKFERQRNRIGLLAMVVGFKADSITTKLKDALGRGLVNNHFEGRYKRVVKLRFPKGDEIMCQLPQEFFGFVHHHNLQPGMHIGCEVNMENIEKNFSPGWKTGHLGVSTQLGLR